MERIESDLRERGDVAPLGDRALLRDARVPSSPSHGLGRSSQSSAKVCVPFFQIKFENFYSLTCFRYLPPCSNHRRVTRGQQGSSHPVRPHSRQNPVRQQRQQNPRGGPDRSRGPECLRKWCESSVKSLRRCGSGGRSPTAMRTRPHSAYATRRRVTGTGITQTLTRQTDKIINI